MSKLSKTAKASMGTGAPKEVKVIPDETYIKNLRYDLSNGIHATQEGAKALLRQYDATYLLLMAKQLEIDNALLLLNQHLSGRKEEGGYKDLDDALRQLVQAYIVYRDLALEQKQGISGTVEIADESGKVVATGVTLGLPYKETPGDLEPGLTTSQGQDSIGG